MPLQDTTPRVDKNRSLYNIKRMAGALRGKLRREDLQEKMIVYEELIYPEWLQAIAKGKRKELAL